MARQPERSIPEGSTSGHVAMDRSRAASNAHVRHRVPKGAMAASLIGAGWMEWLARLPLWRGALVLAYHRIEGDGTPVLDRGVLSATPSSFDAQMRFITRHFDVVPVEAIARDQSSPARRVVVTFDDGYRDNYALALPILRRHGVPAVFFLATRFLDGPAVPWWDEIAWMVGRSDRDELEPGDWLDRPLPLRGAGRRAIVVLTDLYKSLPTDRADAFLDFCGEAMGTGRCGPGEAAELWMTWEMARELRDSGMAIGGHSATHPILARSTRDVQAREITECAQRLDEELGVAMRWFAYPVGLRSAFDETTKDILRSSGVSLAFSLYGGYVRRRPVDPYDVPRASVGIDMTSPAFRAMLTLPGQFARW